MKVEDITLKEARAICKQHKSCKDPQLCPLLDRASGLCFARFGIPADWDFEDCAYVSRRKVNALMKGAKENA